MGWGGIRNLPPGFDATAGKSTGLTIVDMVIRGDVPGLTPQQQDLFKDLKRHLLHQDYARYFETALVCAAYLVPLQNGKYVPQVMHDIIEPSMQVALEQMESIRKEVAKFAASKRKIEYDPVSSLKQMHVKAMPLVAEYPNAAGADKIEPTFQAVLKEIQPALPP
jgi:hypothetical protein